MLIFLYLYISQMIERMNNFLPLDKSISISELSQVFNNTSATYKFYWFLAILEINVREGKSKIEIRDILIQMIVRAWFPVNYFKLSFGMGDNLHKNIEELIRQLNLPIDISATDLTKILRDNNNRDINNLISHFSQQVPYRFLSPWITYRSKSDTIKKSQQNQNNCIYKIDNEKKNIEINPEWISYLKSNYMILQDYTYWNLTQFIQAKNPNTPNISNKLIKPIQRESLKAQREFWYIVFDELGTIDCIYTGNSLTKKNFDMEHFIPWSFVTHNQLWNLVPADGSINSSKSNKLPKLEEFLEPYVTIQQVALEIVNRESPNNRVLEDYLVLGPDIKTILDYSDNELLSSFRNVLAPLIQIAHNSGFQYWNR